VTGIDNGMWTLQIVQTRLVISLGQVIAKGVFNSLAIKLGYKFNLSDQVYTKSL